MQQDYARKARILRRIMSNKANHYKKMNTAVNILTVVIASLVTFVSFSGIENIHRALDGRIFPRSDLEFFSFAFNFITFAFVVLIFAQVFFRYGDRQTQAEKAIVSLSTFINFVRDKSNPASPQAPLSPNDLDVVRERYESIIGSIPANTDAEYEKAKNERTDNANQKTFLFLQSIGKPDEEKDMLKRIVLEDKNIVDILRAVRRYNMDFWIAGGLFRGLVWDRIHAFEVKTPIDDIDIVYFDKSHKSASVDQKFEAELNTKLPGNVWSVKNQARMHIHNQDPPYRSLEDAVAKFPETCTSFAIRMSPDGDLDIVAPHGLSDLFCLIVRPTPHFSGNTARLSQRVTQKDWLKKWPRVRLHF